MDLALAFKFILQIVSLIDEIAGQILKASIRTIKTISCSMHSDDNFVMPIYESFF